MCIDLTLLATSVLSSSVFLGLVANNTLSTSLDLHERLLGIAKRAVVQVRENQAANDAVLPPATDPPPAPPTLYGK
jgi:hypothetical protein